MGRSLKAQMKYANKIGSKYSIVLGEDELAKNEAVLKSMFSGSTRPVPLGDTFTDVVYEEILNTAYNDLEEAMDTMEHGPGCSCGHC